MNAPEIEPTDAALWLYALTLICADGPREFRFRVDPVEPEKWFGRSGNSLRESPGAVPIAGMIVAEIRLPEVKLHAGTIRAEWAEPEFADVVAIADAARPGLGRLGSHPSTFLTPKASVPLKVLAVRWTRWAGDSCCMATCEPIGGNRAAELLGEAIEKLEAMSLLQEWREEARPFARFNRSEVRDPRVAEATAESLRLAGVKARIEARGIGAVAYRAHEQPAPPGELIGAQVHAWLSGYFEELSYAVDCDPEDAAKELWAIEREVFEAEGAGAYRIAVARREDDRPVLADNAGGPYDADSKEGQAWFDGWLKAGEPRREGGVEDYERRCAQEDGGDL